MKVVAQTGWQSSNRDQENERQQRLPLSYTDQQAQLHHHLSLPLPPPLPPHPQHQHHQQQQHQQQQHQDQPPVTPTYTSPRLAPTPPSSAPAASQSFAFKRFQSIFIRKQHRRSPHPHRVPSSNSLHSAYSSSSKSSNFSEGNNFHPYSAMLPALLPVVANHDSVPDEEDCPVCLESLTFSFRLPGERPPIVPECGHALHEVHVVSFFFERVNPLANQFLFFLYRLTFDHDLFSYVFEPRHVSLLSTAHRPVK
jgi:hypothetical protein